MIVDAETTPFVDVSGARMLVATHEELRSAGVRLVLARAVGQVHDVLGCVTDERDLTAVVPDDRGGRRRLPQRARKLMSVLTR